ncbi:MAG: coenzyme F420-0:L-glutamate ligase / coenzyme F420:gamma-L-glutamate ligase [Microbacteriaceae bacterium]|nr:coenzyme F420-0:L-glutamate ligase / coenzyme F420:gamma-L-glutamate ligase [Microbacteriaceae bacterium]
MLSVYAVSGIPEIVPGDDLAAIIGDAVRALDDVDAARAARMDGGALADGDILAVTSKIISKAEGRVVEAADREQAITAETVRIVATRQNPGGSTRIVENRLGMVSAAAGVDASNTPEGTVLLLPLDPDASAARLRVSLEQRFGVRLGVIVTDTVGRPWRQGQTDIAIGASGVRLLDDLRGTLDAHGRRLDVTTPAVGDEIAAAADLVKGKSAGLPVAIVRGLGHLLEAAAPGARALVRPAEADMFRLGTDEAWQQGFEAGRAQGGAAAGVAPGEPAGGEGLPAASPAAPPSASPSASPAAPPAGYRADRAD